MHIVSTRRSPNPLPGLLVLLLVGLAKDIDRPLGLVLARRVAADSVGLAKLVDLFIVGIGQFKVFEVGL
jgi:hypothetical protein